MEFFSNLILSRENLVHNIKTIKKKAQNKKICAMIKANAYGHGLKNVVLSLKNFVDFFGVANSEEALEVRQYSYASKILLCGEYNKTKLKNLISNKISLTIFSVKSLINVIEVCKELKTKANVHIKLNTGMNRLGFKEEKTIKNAIKIMEKNKEFICLEGIYSHLFNAESQEVSRRQYFKFIKFLKLFKNLNCINIHLENTVGLFNNVDVYNICNMVRVGIGLYGLEIENQKLKPVMKLTSKIVAIQKVKNEEFCGYGKVVIDEEKFIGIIPLGYADGILRNYKNSFVLVNNIPCKILNVCMDMILIDITKANAKIGDEVIVISNENSSINSANKLAKKLNTISYEVVTNIKHNRLNIFVE